MVETAVPGGTKRERPEESEWIWLEKTWKGLELKRNEVEQVKWKILSRCGDPE